jgi:hypothetical protein
MKSEPDRPETYDPLAVPGLAPPEPAALWEQMVVVEGEQFVLRERVRNGRSHVYDYDWLTGPNPGYGFSSSGPEQSMDDHEAAIRDFLQGIDPDTGYLGG